MTAHHTESDRVRANSAVNVNERIDRKIDASVRQHAVSRMNIEKRFRELDGEWDMERILEANASALAFAGVALAAFVSIHWLWLSAFVLGFLFLHAVQGWCPPVPVLRRLGVRTQREIEQERYALKALRGDFEKLQAEPDPAARADRALEAVRADGFSDGYYTDGYDGRAAAAG